MSILLEKLQFDWKELQFLIDSFPISRFDIPDISENDLCEILQNIQNIKKEINAILDILKE